MITEVSLNNLNLVLAKPIQVVSKKLADKISKKIVSHQKRIYDKYDETVEGIEAAYADMLNEKKREESVNRLLSNNNQK